MRIKVSHGIPPPARTFKATQCHTSIIIWLWVKEVTLIIEISALPNGAHRNQSGIINNIPEGWLEVPVALEPAAQSFLPFVLLTVEDGGLTDIRSNEEAKTAI